MRMRNLVRSVAVGAVVLGLAGAGAASAQAHPKPKPGNYYNHVSKQIEKTWIKLQTSDDDKIINDSVIFVFGPQQSHVR